MNGPLATLISHLARHVEASESMQTSLMGLLGPFRQVYSKDAREAHVVSSKDVAPSKSFAVYQETLHVQTPRKLKTCPSTCSCGCHMLGKTSIPYNLRYLFGRGSIKTKGPPMDTKLCNKSSCRRTASRHVYLEYILSSWIAIRMLSMLYTSSPTHSPEFLIRFPRLVSLGNDGFQAVWNGDLEQLRCLVACGECTPDDVDERGDSLLAVSERC